jgi:hypothetical protein
MDLNERPLAEKILEAEAILARFPDAIEHYYHQYPDYRCPTIAKDPDLQFDYSGFWQNLSVRPYVNMEFIHNGKTSQVRVGGCPSYYSMVRLQFSSLNPTLIATCCWNNYEEEMYKNGFTEKHVISTYKKYLIELTKNPNPEIKLMIETLPDYIKNLLPYI